MVKDHNHPDITESDHSSGFAEQGLLDPGRRVLSNPGELLHVCASQGTDNGAQYGMSVHHEHPDALLQPEDVRPGADRLGAEDPERHEDQRGEDQGTFRNFPTIFSTAFGGNLVESIALTLSLGQASNHQPLTVAINNYLGEYSIDWGHLVAGAVIATIPVILLFAVIEGRVVSGLTAGSIK